MTLFANTIRNQLVFFYFVQTAIVLSLIFIFSWQASNTCPEQSIQSIGLWPASLLGLSVSGLASIWLADKFILPVKSLTETIVQYAHGLTPEFKPIRPNPKQTPAELMQLLAAVNKVLENCANRATLNAVDLSSAKPSPEHPKGIKERGWVRGNQNKEKAYFIPPHPSLLPQGEGAYVLKSTALRATLPPYQNQALLPPPIELAEFAAIATHDLQEPLRKIQAFANLLQQHYADALDGQGLDYLARMQSATERMRLLTNNLLSFADVTESPANFTKVSLNQVTAEVIEDLDRVIKLAHAQIMVSAMPDINADAVQIWQLLQNLLSNAIKFSRPGISPEISIQARLIKPSNGLGNFCELIVSDNGIGFEMIYTEKIFAMFQRLHGRSDYPGTGVGLAICKKIAQRHGGDISVSSQINQGTTFTVLLRTMPMASYGLATDKDSEENNSIGT